MDEVKDVGVNEEIASPQENLSPDKPEPTETVAAVNKVAEEQPQDKNWRALRQRKEELEAESRRKDELIDKLLQAQLREQQPTVKKVEEEPEEPDDEFVNKGRVKKLAKKQVEPLEIRIKELEEKLNHKQQFDLINSLRSRFPDFDELVNTETLKIFETEEPELAEAIASTKDPYKIGLQSYKYIKKLGLQNKVKEESRANEVEKKLEKNAKAVPSPQAYEKRPMAQAFKMTENMQKELYNEMTQSALLASSVPELR